MGQTDSWETNRQQGDKRKVGGQAGSRETDSRKTDSRETDSRETDRRETDSRETDSSGTDRQLGNRQTAGDRQTTETDIQLVSFIPCV